MSYEQTITEALAPTAAEPTPQSCACEQPRPRERAGYKGASRLYCERCELPVPIRLGG